MLKGKHSDSAVERPLLVPIVARCLHNKASIYGLPNPVSWIDLGSIGQ